MKGETEEYLERLRSRRIRKNVSADSDSGYHSMMESGYSSHRDSASQNYITYFSRTLQDNPNQVPTPPAAQWRIRMKGRESG